MNRDSVSNVRNLSKLFQKLWKPFSNEISHNNTVAQRTFPRVKWYIFIRFRSPPRGLFPPVILRCNFSPLAASKRLTRARHTLRGILNKTGAQRGREREMFFQEIVYHKLNSIRINLPPDTYRTYLYNTTQRSFPIPFHVLSSISIIFTADENKSSKYISRRKFFFPFENPEFSDEKWVRRVWNMQGKIVIVKFVPLFAMFFLSPALYKIKYLPPPSRCASWLMDTRKFDIRGGYLFY